MEYLSSKPVGKMLHVVDQWWPEVSTELPVLNWCLPQVVFGENLAHSSSDSGPQSASQSAVP